MLRLSAPRKGCSGWYPSRRTEPRALPVDGFACPPPLPGSRLLHPFARSLPGNRSHHDNLKPRGREGVGGVLCEAACLPDVLKSSLRRATSTPCAPRSPAERTPSTSDSTRASTPAPAPTTSTSSASPRP